jgi:hypothetical protein
VRSDKHDVTVWNACVDIVETTLASIDQHMGADADDFNREMPCYCALATFGTFLSVLVKDESCFRPLIDCIFRFAEHAEIEHRGLLVMLASQRVDYGARDFSADLARDIVEHLISLEPPHAPVFRDSVDAAFRKASEFITPSV